MYVGVPCRDLLWTCRLSNLLCTCRLSDLLCTCRLSDLLCTCRLSDLLSTCGLSLTEEVAVAQRMKIRERGVGALYMGYSGLISAAATRHGSRIYRCNPRDTAVGNIDEIGETRQSQIPVENMRHSSFVSA